MLSVIIITKNEAQQIRRCLTSVQWANEIIVLDSGSTDETVAICQEYTDQVFETDWPGFGPQKNRALAKAQGDWVLSIDADEWLTPALTAEIQAVLQQPKADAYNIPRRNIFWGFPLKHGIEGRDRVLRLFKRARGQFTDQQVHERVVVDGVVSALRQHLMHDSYQTLSDSLARLNYYSSLTADQRARVGKRSSLCRAFFSGVWTFINAYFLRCGFLDRKAGFVAAVLNAEASFYRHLKLSFTSLSSRADRRRGL